MVVTASVQNYLIIHSCDDTTNVTGETPIPQTGFYKENSTCLGFTCRGSGDNDITFSVTKDLSGASHLHGWYLSAVIAEFNWLELVLSDGTNTGVWDVFHSNDYPGGWYNFVVDYTRTPDSGTAPVLANVNSIVIRINHTGVAKNAENTWLDHLYIGDGIDVYGDDGGSEFDFEDIYIYDSNDTTSGRGWGLITKYGGVYYLTGNLTIGDDSGTDSTKFQSLSQNIILEERKYNGSTQNLDAVLYEIKCVGNATGTTAIEFGDVSGGKGISGCNIVCNDSSRAFKFTATDTNVGTLGLYATVFNTHGVIDLMVNSATREVIGCTFTNSADQIQPNTMTFTENFILSGTSTDGSVLFESTSHNISYNNFINCSRATEFPTADTYAVTGDQFSGNTYDVHFSSLTGNLIINCGGIPKANPNSVLNDSSGTVTINNTVNITITVRDASDESLISGALVYMRASSGSGDYPYQESVGITRSGSTATVAHTTHGLQSGEYVLISGANEEEYNGVYAITVTGVSEYTYTLTGTPDTPATGSPASTFVLILDTTVSGVVADTMRYLTLDQPFTGKVRKSSASPYYKTAPLSGIVENMDFATTVYMSADE